MRTSHHFRPLKYFLLSLDDSEDEDEADEPDELEFFFPFFLDKDDECDECDDCDDLDLNMELEIDVSESEDFLAGDGLDGFPQ